MTELVWDDDYADVEFGSWEAIPPTFEYEEDDFLIQKKLKVKKGVVILGKNLGPPKKKLPKNPVICPQCQQIKEKDKKCKNCGYIPVYWRGMEVASNDPGMPQVKPTDLYNPYI